MHYPLDSRLATNWMEYLRKFTSNNEIEPLHNHSGPIHLYRIINDFDDEAVMVEDNPVKD